MTSRSLNLKTNTILCSVIVLCVSLVYYRMFENGFVFLDDYLYIYGNKKLQTGFNAESMRWAFSLDSGVSYWQPLTLLSLMADYQFFGLDARWYHLENLLIHLSTTVVFFLFIRRISGSPWQSATAAAIFALHPLNVESIVWAVERKNVLSLLFTLLAIGFYHARHTTGKRAYLYISLLLHAVGIMVKPILVILPALLLIVDFWPLRRLQVSTFTQMLRSCLTLSLEKTPYWLLSLAVLSTSFFHVTHHKSLVVGPSWINRTENALVSLVSYLGKLFWPENLGVFYPLREFYLSWEVAGASIILVSISFFAWRFRGSRPWFLAGWAWYVICLVPVLGFIRAGLWPAMADRFAYFPQLGIIVIVVFGIAEIYVARLFYAVAVLSLFVIVTLSFITARQITYWENSVTLIDRTLAVTDDNMMVKRYKAMYGWNTCPPDMIYVKRKLDNAYIKQLKGDSVGALEDYHKIADLGIDNKPLFQNMALVYKKINDVEKYNYYSEKALRAGSFTINMQ